MRVTLSSSPAYTVAYVRLQVGQSVLAESGSMVAMSDGMRVGASMDGGIVRSAFRRVMTDESLFFARYTADVEDAWVALAPRFPGDIATVDVRPDNPLRVQSGSLLAYGDTVGSSGRLGNVSQFMLREGMTVIELSGNGQALVCAYGAIERFDVAAGQSMIVDTGHLAAWTASMDIRVGPLTDLATSAVVGEGLVGKLTGPGTVYVQTRAEQQLRSWLWPDRGMNDH